MTLPTHAAFASYSILVILALISSHLNPLYILTACFTSLLPDIDYPSSTIGRALPFFSRTLERRFGHRTITHSLIGFVIFAVLVLPLHFFNGNLWMAALAGYLSHILLDCTNKSGVALFWPEAIQAVMPGVEGFRFVHAGKGEAILFFILIGLNVVTFPIANMGLIRFLHYIRQDAESAVSDFRDFADEHMVWAELRGIDSLTNKAVKGEFKAVGADGATTLYISNSGKLRSVGIKDEVNIRAVRIRCRKADKINMVISEADLKGRTLEDLLYFLDPDKEHYLFSSLAVRDKVSLEKRPGWFEPVSYVNNRLELEFANWGDIVSRGLQYMAVEEGKVLIKTVLKENEVMQPSRQDKAGMRQRSKSVKITFSVESPAEVLVKKGQEIKPGQALAKMARSQQRELVRLKKELGYQQGLINKGGGSVKARNEVLAKIQKMREDYMKAKINKFSGYVDEVKIEKVRDGSIDVEIEVLADE